MIKASIGGNPAELNKLIGRLPGLVQAAAYEKGLSPAAKVVEDRLKELTPQSSITGTTKKWDVPTKAKRAGELPLNKTTGKKIWRSRSSIAYAFIGYKWPEGNKAHFIVVSKGETREVVLWKKRTGVTVRKEYDILKQSLDDSRAKASAAFTTAVIKDIEKRMKAMAADYSAAKGRA